jgi:flagellar assembly protein FliH
LEAKRLMGRPHPKAKTVTPLMSEAPPQPPMSAVAATGVVVPIGPDLAEEKRALAAERELMQKQTQQAHEAGFAQGVAEARAQWQADLARLSTLADTLAQQAAATIDGWEAPVVELVMAACREILGDAAVQGQAVRHVVRQALSQARKETLLEVRVHGDDLTFLRDATGEDAMDEVPLVADKSIAQGGCIVRFAGGEIDARIDHQLRLLARTLSTGLSDA